MGKVVTIAEIESNFDAEWVLIEDPETDQSLKVQKGIVLWHSKDRDEVYRKAIELHPRRFATIYTGKMLKNTSVVL